MSVALPVATERVLLRRYREFGDHAAREQLVAIMTPLIEAVVRRYRGAGDADDLRQAASLGLAKAIERFDPRFGVPLRVYAMPTMNGEVLRHLRDTTWAVRLPRPLQERALAVSKASDDLTRRRGSAPAPEELAEELDLPVDEVLEALQAADAHYSISLDAPREARDGDAGTLADVLGRDDPRLTRAEQIADLRGLRGTLTEMERLLLHLRFVQERSQRDIARAVSMSETEVARTIADSLAHLHEAVEPSRQPPGRTARHLSISAAGRSRRSAPGRGAAR
jgi:RNA polymerase sigma-B factor